MFNANSPSAQQATSDPPSPQMGAPIHLGLLTSWAPGYWQRQVKALVCRHSHLLLRGEKMAFQCSSYPEPLARRDFTQLCVLILARDGRAWQPAVLFSPL